jgi:hypothetical protein
MAGTTGVEYREKNDGMLCKLEWNTEKGLSSAWWNVEKYCFDGVEFGERAVEHRESSEGKPWNVEKNLSAIISQYVVRKTLITSDLRLSTFSIFHRAS